MPIRLLVLLLTVLFAFIFVPLTAGETGHGRENGVRPDGAVGAAGSGFNEDRYDNTLAKDFIMDAPWRVIDTQTAIPLTIVLKDCDEDDIRELHWIRCRDVTGGGSTTLWFHDFGDERIGDNASEDNYWTWITTVTENHPSLPNGTALTPQNLGYSAGDAIQLEVEIYYRDDIFNYTETRYLRVHVGNGRFPWPEDWFGGDTHFHSMYTNNIAEFGAPLPAVAITGKAMGLDWLTVTDHSCDLDETGDGSFSYGTQQWEYTIQSTTGIQTIYRDVTAAGGSWNAIASDIQLLEDDDFRLYRGVEINLASVDPGSWEKTLHALFYNPAYIHSPDSGAIGERPVSPSVTAGLDLLDPSGFAYAAHPCSDLGMEWGGTDWAVNGTLWGDADLTSALQRPNFIGIEAFNTRALYTSTDQNNPWSDFDAGVPADNPYPDELLQGISMWDTLLAQDLDGGDPRGVFLSGGSDAHGDFNYAAFLSLDNYATDNAMGKVQTVVFVPGPYQPGILPPTSELTAALRDGRSVVTDGPFVEFGLDLDGDGAWYGTGDLMIGDSGSVLSTDVLPLYLRWSSLVEFGEIVSIRVIDITAGGSSILYQIDPSSSGQGLSGDTSIDLGSFSLIGTRYLRVECLTSDGLAGHRAYTNPIRIEFISDPETVDCSYGIIPAEGTLPFAIQHFVTIANSYGGSSRRMAARIDVTLAGGAVISNWRSGHTTIQPLDSFFTGWNTSLPASGNLVGENLFMLTVQDVTPAPFNQPPHPPAGSTDSAAAAVTGLSEF